MSELKDALGATCPETFPTGKVYTYFRNWRIDGTWVQIHDRLREWTRAAHDRYPNPSEAIALRQSVKTVAMVSEAVGFDAGKLVKGRKRFLTVDTLGLAAASIGHCCQRKVSAKEVNKCSKR